MIHKLGCRHPGDHAGDCDRSFDLLNPPAPLPDLLSIDQDHVDTIPPPDPEPVRSDWFITATGRRAYILSPEATDICIEDISAALSRICRFGGHTDARREGFYSVAQHSIHVSKLVPSRMALQGLLHDATEAYLGDVIRPLKRVLGAVYSDLEDRWWSEISRRFGVAYLMSPEIKRADLIALRTERRDLVSPHAWAWVEEEQMAEVDPSPIVALGPYRARMAFMTRFEQLTGTGAE